MNIVVVGLTITSSWGNGHATTWRALVRALARRGHDVVFLEDDKPWYAANRDLREPPFCEARLYRGAPVLRRDHAAAVVAADVVVVGSFVSEGAAVLDWVLDIASGVVAFYDIDTPVTLAALARGDCGYLEARQVPDIDLYLSFTGGPTLERLRRDFGAPCARPLYCSFDPEHYCPEPTPAAWDLGYLGTYSGDRQPALERLLLEPARRSPERRFVVAGPQYPETIAWPTNVERIAHLSPQEHRRFYNAQRFTLNVTRADMVAAGWSPSVRLFEAAACGTPILSDWWQGLDTLFRPGEEIIVVADAEQALAAIAGLDEARRRRIGEAGRARVLAAHTADHRAREFEAHVAEIRERP